MIKKISGPFVVVCLLVLANSCNALNDSPIDSDVYDLPAECELKPEQFKKMLDEDITKDIDCLKTSLEQFMDMVKSQEPDTINYQNLVQFTSKFFPDDKDDIQQSLDLLFDLNMVMMHAHPNKISRSDLPKIINIFKAINIYGSVIKKTLDNGELNYWPKREEYRAALESFSSTLLQNMASSGDSSDRALIIMKFLDRVKSTMGGDFDLDLEMIRSFLFGKVLLLGGPRESITTDEMRSLIQKVPNLLLFVTDTVFNTKEALPSAPKRDLNFLKAIRKIKPLLYPFANDQFIATHDEVIKAVAELDFEDFNIYRAQDSIFNLKEKILESPGDNYRYGDFLKILSWGEDLFESFVFNNDAFDLFEKELLSPGPITSLERPDPSQFKYARVERFNYLWVNFFDTVRRFRFFHDDSGRQSYTRQYQRSKYGINFLSLIRWGLDKALRVYGVNPPGELATLDDESTIYTRKKAKIPELRNFLSSLKSLMLELEMWPMFFERFLGEAMYSSDLFQYNSNGDEYLDINEATEYLTNIFSSANYSLDVIDKLKLYCKPLDAKEETFDSGCYRHFIYKIMFDDLKMEDRFPGLYRYYKESTEKEGIDYLISVEKYAREIYDDKVPMNKIDLGRLFVSFSNIDGLIAKYDYNDSNSLEKYELDNAFPIFEKTLITYGNLKPSELMFTHSIFLYLIKYMKTPKDGFGGSLDLIKFHYLVNKDDIVAKRLNIGVILAFFVAI